MDCQQLIVYGIVALIGLYFLRNMWFKITFY